MTSEICFHCATVGSTPVGLWAQACSKIMLLAGAFYTAMSDTLHRRCAHLQVFKHALQVETVGLLVKIAVLLDFEARVAENVGVVAPRRRWQVDALGIRVKALQKHTANAQCTCSRNGLGNGNLSGAELKSAIGAYTAVVLLDQVSAVCELGRGLAKIGEASNGQVFLVQVLVQQHLLGLRQCECRYRRKAETIDKRQSKQQSQWYLEHTLEHVGLSGIVTVRTNTQVHLVGAFVALERLGDAQNRI